jgi:hypothetical protein
MSKSFGTGADLPNWKDTTSVHKSTILSDAQFCFLKRLSLQNDASASQVASQLLNRSFDRISPVAGCGPKVSERDKFGDHRRRCSRPLETDDTTVRHRLTGRIAVWAAEASI